MARITLPLDLAPSSPARVGIRSSVTVEGIGLHTGALCKVQLKPTLEGSGLRLNGVPISSLKAGTEDWATYIVSDQRKIQTPEHLFGTLFAFGVDDIDIRVDGPEIPILDGSGAPWLKMLDLEQGLTPRQWKILPPTLIVKDRDCSAEVIAPLSEQESHQLRPPTPEGGVLPLKVNLRLRYPPLNTMNVKVHTVDTLLSRVIPARTFGRRSDEARLRQLGLIKGVTEENTLIIEPNGSHPRLRVESEPAYHKVLDLFGDLALLEFRLLGSLSINRGSHALNHKLCKTLAQSFSE